MTNWDAVAYFASGALFGSVLTALALAQVVIAFMRRHTDKLKEYDAHFRKSETQ